MTAKSSDNITIIYYAFGTTSPVYMIINRFIVDNSLILTILFDFLQNRGTGEINLPSSWETWILNFPKCIKIVKFHCFVCFTEIHLDSRVCFSFSLNFVNRDYSDEIYGVLVVQNVNYNEC